MFPQLRHCWLPLWLIFASGQPVLALPAVTTTPTSDAGNLLLDGQGTATTQVVKVATLTLSTDSPNGYTVFVSSGNVAKLDATSIPFQVTIVDAGSSSPGEGAFTVASGNNYTLSTSQANTANKDLYIRYTPAALQDPGSYSASILLTIVDNP